MEWSVIERTRAPWPKRPPLLAYRKVLLTFLLRTPREDDSLYSHWVRVKHRPSSNRLDPTTSILSLMIELLSRNHSVINSLFHSFVLRENIWYLCSSYPNSDLWVWTRFPFGRLIAKLAYLYFMHGSSRTVLIIGRKLGLVGRWSGALTFPSKWNFSYGNYSGIDSSVLFYLLEYFTLKLTLVLSVKSSLTLIHMSFQNAPLLLLTGM